MPLGRRNRLLGREKQSLTIGHRRRRPRWVGCDERSRGRLKATSAVLHLLSVEGLRGHGIRRLLSDWDSFTIRAGAKAQAAAWVLAGLRSRAKIRGTPAGKSLSDWQKGLGRAVKVSVALHGAAGENGRNLQPDTLGGGKARDGGEVLASEDLHLLVWQLGDKTAKGRAHDQRPPVLG